MENNEPILTSFYGNSIIVKFYPKSHQYWISKNGGPFKRGTGTTSYLGIKDKSRPLQIWQQQMTADFLLGAISRGIVIDVDKALEAVIQCDIAKDTAADIGKDLHSWAENYIRYKLKEDGFKSVPDIPKFTEAIQGTEAFLKWEKERKIKFISTEKVVCSKKYNYFGIEDVELVADGKYCDADFKSSNGLYNSVRMQTAAYASARMEAGGKKSQDRCAIRFSKYSEEEYMKREERKREIKKAIARIQKKDYKEYPAKPYQVFEAKFLDDQPEFFNRDFKAFLNCKALFEWDKLTDPFYCGENW